MAKLNLPPFVGQPQASQLNTWKALIEAVVEDTLSRSGELPNSLESSLDVADNNLLNVGTVNANEVMVGGVPVADLTGVPGPQGIQGDKGDDFSIDAFGLETDLSDHDAEGEGFVYLATDTGNVFFRVGEAGNWSDPVSLEGPEGPEGQKGVKGDKGDEGAPGVGGLIHVGETPPEDTTYFWLDTRPEEEPEP